DPSAWRTRATVSDRVLRSVSACAFPRPSATASAKFANNTVNHSHNVTSPVKTLCDDDADGRFQKNNSVVNTLPISTMNITGLRIMSRGLSFLIESTTARFMIAGSNSDFAPAGRCRTFGGRGSAVTVMSELPLQLFDDRTERHDREVRQADHDHDHAGE